MVCRLALGGPLTSEGKAAPLVRVPVLAAGDTTTWQAAFRITGFGRLTIQPYITLPAQAAMLPGAIGSPPSSPSSTLFAFQGVILAVTVVVWDPSVPISLFAFRGCGLRCHTFQPSINLPAQAAMLPGVH